MTEYRVTFGMKYRTQQHPTFPAAHPDGWLTIVAATEEVAREIACAVLGKEWAFIYAPPFDTASCALLHSMGEIARIEADLASTTPSPLAVAVDEFVDLWGVNNDVAEIGVHLNCGETEALARLFESVGASDSADYWRRSHAQDDDEGDQHWALRVGAWSPSGIIHTVDAPCNISGVGDEVIAVHEQSSEVTCRACLDIMASVQA